MTLLLGLLATARAQNVLVLVADDVSIDKISSYTADYPTYALQATLGTVDYLPQTPTIDGLATSGVRFSRAWASPNCTPTRASIHTGGYPFRSGLGWPLSLPEPAGAGLDTSSGDLLGQVFEAGGYATGYFGKWHLGSEDASGARGMPAVGPMSARPHPDRSGWNRYYGHLGGALASYGSWTVMDWIDGGWLFSGTVSVTTRHPTEAVAEEAANWIAAQSDPWIAFVTFNAAHEVGSGWTYGDELSGCWRSPKAEMNCLNTTPASCTDEERAVYRAHVECIDVQVEGLLDAIPDTELDDTLIVFLGDNGTPDEVQEGVFSTLGGGGKGTNHEDGVRVPLIVADGSTWRTGAAGALTNPGLVSNAAVHVVDLYATLTEWAFGTPTASADSSSLWPCLTTSNTTCGWLNLDYTEAYNAANHLAAVRYTGRDKMRLEYLTDDPNTAIFGDPCVEESFFDVDADPFELSPQAWTGLRASRLRNHFTSLHSGQGSWADGLPYCL